MEAIQRYELCEPCSLRQGFREARSTTDPRRCFICRGLTTRVDEIRSDVLRRLRGYEYRTFSVGLSLPEGMQEREDQLRAEYKLKGRETIKAWLSKSLSERIARATRRRVDKLNPELAILVDLGASEVRLNARPVFIYGRYTKPAGIGQRKTFCTSCRGSGCAVCGYSGHDETKASVESTIQKRLGPLLGSKKMIFAWIGTAATESVVGTSGRPVGGAAKHPRERGEHRG